MAEQHAIEVKWQRAWSEWLASCSCGWVGSYVKNKSTAEHEGEAHVVNPHG